MSRRKPSASRQAPAKRVAPRSIPAPPASSAAPAIDWKRFVAHHWERAPGKAALPGGSPLPIDDVFAMAARAAAPFRDGLRFRAIPDVRFLAGGSQLHAPGGRLPAATDRTFGRYLARLRRQHGDRGFQLLITHPLMIDFALWSRARALLSDLLDEIGVPVLPIACELVLGSWARSSGGSQARPHHAPLTFVLHGELTALLGRPGRAGDGAPPLALVGRAGDMLCWPSGTPHEEAGRDCVALRAWIPVAGARVADAVKDVAVALMDRRREERQERGARGERGEAGARAAQADHRVPYLPLPAARRRGEVGAAAPLVAAARLLGEVTREELPRAMQIQWAKRVSARALEPVPPAAAEPALSDGALLLLTAPPLIMPLGGELSIWAVHGHAFSVRDEAAARAVLARMSAGPLRIAELPSPLRPAARELAAALLRLRAARVGDAGPPRSPRRGSGR